MLDLTGGTLSLLQSALYTIALGEPFFAPGAFNLVKFILSICSILFDSIFLFQHFVLYRNAHDDLGNGDEANDKDVNPDKLPLNTPDNTSDAYAT